MEKEKIFVVQPFLPPLEEYETYLKEIWNNKILTNQGPLHNKFAEVLKSSINAEDITLFCNGHLALECALKALDLKSGCEIITTPFTFVSTTHAISNCGYKPVFCDIKLDDYTIDEEKIECLINENTVAIMPVHVYGYPCEVKKINALAKKYNLKVIYDAAHAFGVKVDNESILNYGDISMISFHATKLFHTIEGGMLVHNSDLKNKLDTLKNFGIVDKDDIVEQGINAKMNEFQAAMGLANMPYLNNIIARRKEITEKYRALLKIDGIKLVHEKNNIQYNYAYFPILIDEKKYGITRDELYDILMKNNIFSRKYFYPLTSDAVCYKKNDKNNLNNAKYVADRILTLPLYPNMSDENIKKICEIIINRGENE